MDFKYDVKSTDSDVAVLDVAELLGGTIKDLVGNELVRSVKSISSYGIRIDNTPPTVTMSQNQNSAYSKTHSTLVTISDNGSGLSGQTYKYFWSQNSSISSVDWNSVINQNPSTQASNVVLSGVTGKYYLHIRSQDLAGNVGYYTSGAVCLDNQGPVS